MAKVTLGKKPETITHTVQAQMPDGTQAELAMVYRYRTRKQFAALIDEFFGAGTGDGQEPATVGEATARGIKKNVEYILAIAVGWDVQDAPFDAENIEQLCDEAPGVMMKIMSDYREAITEGRLGN